MPFASCGTTRVNQGRCTVPRTPFSMHSDDTWGVWSKRCHPDDTFEKPIDFVNFFKHQVLSWSHSSTCRRCQWVVRQSPTLSLFDKVSAKFEYEPNILHFVCRPFLQTGCTCTVAAFAARYRWLLHDQRLLHRCGALRCPNWTRLSRIEIERFGNDEILHLWKFSKMFDNWVSRTSHQDLQKLASKLYQYPPWPGRSQWFSMEKIRSIRE